MNIGTQLLAPDGFGSLSEGTTYSLFCNRSALSSTLLVWFAKGKQDWTAHFVRLPKAEFERGLLVGALVPVILQATVPPWLSAYEGVDIDALEAGRTASKQTYRERAELRFEAIAPLLQRLDAIEAADDPYKFILKYTTTLNARIACDKVTQAEGANCGAKQHPRRLSLWLCAYLVHGRALTALLPAFSENGRWQRSEHASITKRLGRPPKSNAGHGHSAVPLAMQIQDAYVKRAGLGITMTTIYRSAMLHDFKCKTAQTPEGHEYFYQPSSNPYPTFSQFHYWVLKGFGLERIQRSKYGDARFRQKLAPIQGRFSEECANFYERTETDCYQIKERPMQLLSSEPGLPLVVAVLSCSTTSLGLGIGFSYGAERTEAYRAMQFCAAVPKSYFGRLFGLDISDSDWPGQGVPPRLMPDRGPGAAEVMIGTDEAEIPIRELTPSYEGQSKATVEASHPRNTSTQGAPSFVISELNAFQMAKREVMRMLANNASRDVSTHLTPEMVAGNVQATPRSMANFLIDRGRCDSITVPIATAVRQYLKPVVFELKEDGLWLESLRFVSDELTAQGIQNAVWKGQNVAIPGFIYPMSVRMAWVDVCGRLYEVEATLPIRDDTEQLNMSLSDLRQFTSRLRDLRAAQRDHSMAVRARAELEFYEQTGIHWDAGTRKSGRLPAKRSHRETMPTATGKRRRARPR